MLNELQEIFHAEGAELAAFNILIINPLRTLRSLREKIARTIENREVRIEMKPLAVNGFHLYSRFADLCSS